jgi:O-antigen/teichoic acid export membrane protein
VVNLGLNFALIPEYGIEAAAWVTFATEMVVVSFTLFAVLRRMEMTLSIRRLVLAALAAAASGLALWGLRELGFGAIALIASMAVIYPLALLCLRALDLGELRELISARKSAEAPF